MKVSFTPGPWVIPPKYTRISVWTEDGERHIADCKSESASAKENHANARLIAAAPDLLNALQRLLRMVENGANSGVVKLAAQNAISKALSDV